MLRKRKIQIAAVLGLLVSLYAWNVEQNLDNPFKMDYKPACNGIFGGNCGTVFKSEYAHILSHWGFVPKGHPLDLSLAASGMLMYTSYLVAITVPFRAWWREPLFLTVAICGALFSCYLLYVLKVVLKEFCIVCFSFHVVNFCMLALAVLEYRAASAAKLSKQR